jgi:hypothetical protein
MAYDQFFRAADPIERQSWKPDPSIAQFIRKAFLISDNDAYNRMYEFVGQILNRQLRKGFKERIVRQFMPLTEAENRHTSAVRFLDQNGGLLYLQPPACNLTLFSSPGCKSSRAYLDAGIV